MHLHLGHAMVNGLKLHFQIARIIIIDAYMYTADLLLPLHNYCSAYYQQPMKNFT
jgi:hypothetical protein